MLRTILIFVDRMATFLVEIRINCVHFVEMAGLKMYECGAFEFERIFHVQQQSSGFSSHFITNMKKPTMDRFNGYCSTFYIMEKSSPLRAWNECVRVV